MRLRSPTTRSPSTTYRTTRRETLRRLRLLRSNNAQKRLGQVVRYRLYTAKRFLGAVDSPFRPGVLVWTNASGGRVTLPPGLQAVRERAKERFPTEWQEGIRASNLAAYVPALLDLIETLAGAAELITQPGESNCDCVNCRRLVRAALDKYREFK